MGKLHRKDIVVITMCIGNKSLPDDLTNFLFGNTDKFLWGEDARNFKYLSNAHCIVSRSSFIGVNPNGISFPYQAVIHWRVILIASNAAHSEKLKISLVIDGPFVFGVRAVTIKIHSASATGWRPKI